MPSQRAEELFDQALDVLDAAEQSGDPKGMKDAASLLSLSIKTAGEPFPAAELALAMTAVRLQDAKTALAYADLVLKHDVPMSDLSFEAQLVRVDIALAKVKYIKGGVLGWAQLADQGGYVGLLMGIFQTTDTQGQFRLELERLVKIFTQLCTLPRPASEFIGHAETLINIADIVRDNNVPMRGKRIQLYEVVANASVANLSYENDDEKKKVSLTQSIAAGRGQL